MWMIWLALTAGFGFLLIHPYVTYPLSLMLLRRIGFDQPLNMVDGTATPSIDIVLCAFNEERVIETKLANCLDIARRYPDVKVHAYSDGSSDGTAAILRAHSDRVRAVISLERTGKSAGMNELVAGCTGQIVVFTDANVILDPQAFGSLHAYFSDPRVGCVCGHLIYVNASESATAGVGSAYWRLEESIKDAESATGSVMGADGSIFAIRRHLYREVPVDIIDDMFTSFSILCDGWRVVRAPDLVAFERSAAASGDEFRRKVRIACRSFNCHRRLWPRLRRLGPLDLYKYASHKLLRWFSAVWLVLALLSLLAWLASVGFAGVGFILVLALLLVLATGSRFPRLRVPGALFSLCVAFFATGYGVWRSLRGDRFRTWTVVQTGR
jgi:cellulose synthase/poly-beta-1,6-N-acetylglucosamine synthase-like glycosyltransferase